MWIINWIKEKLGMGCRCGSSEFTRWEDHIGNFTIPQHLDRMMGVIVDEIEVTKRWQERTCTLCGRTQQRDLKIPGNPPSKE